LPPPGGRLTRIRNRSSPPRAGRGEIAAAMTPTLLAFDTATDVCSVALAHGGRVAERSETVGQRHSERILPMVQALLREADLQLPDCDAVAFGAGPGAFTGLRIACGVAQGLAFGAGRPVVAVGNLEALALAAADAWPGVRRVLAAVDARMQEAYWALFAIDAGFPSPMSAPALASSGELAEICRREAPDLVAGNALRAFPELDAGLACARAADVCASAASIARLAVRKFADGGAVQAELAAPVYVRDRVALTVEERRAAAAGRR
jgi:tRNA threonylcarbamoyladenosine biosynthesis protein TsaB